MSTFLSIFWTFLFIARTDATSLPAALQPSRTISATSTAKAEPRSFSNGLPDVSVRFGDQSVSYETMAVFALPGERVPIEVSDDQAFVEASSGTITRVAPGRFEWQGPSDAGDAVLRVRDANGAERVTMNAFVMVPYSEMKNGLVRGYRVGAYPEPRSGKTYESRPRGFVRVTSANEEIAVVPHFTLGQFVCKSGAGYPKYIVLQHPLLVRLENLLATANESGIQAKTFHVMSAYRTPQYNKAIGNTTSFTRHQYGDAADIFVDEDGDGRMDDLNHDGRCDKQDAMVLHHLAERTEGTPEAGGLDGGLSAYSPTHSHGAFVHVDTRGYEARW
jgi:hypothetical protein